MKRYISTHLFLIFALLVSASVAQVTPPIPPELNTLKIRYAADLQTARQPIRARYISSLETMLRSITKSGDLDAALAVQQELNSVNGKTGTVSSGKVTPELTTLKSRYEAAVQTASEGIQTHYIAALEALQNTFTKRGNLPGALAVRQEVAATKAEGNARAAAPTPAPAQPVQPVAGVELSRFLPGTKWITDQKDGFVKEISFTMDGNLVRTDQNNNTLQTTYQMGGDADSVSYKKSEGK